jgi:hypothetical protein
MLAHYHAGAVAELLLYSGEPLIIVEFNTIHMHSVLLSPALSMPVFPATLTSECVPRPFPRVWTSVWFLHAL